MPLYKPLLKLLLSVDDVNIWISYLKKVQQNRKEGAAKAAKTRCKSRQAVQRQYKCGVCQAVFEEETKESEMWIGCEECDSWFHWTCGHQSNQIHRHVPHAQQTIMKYLTCFHQKY